MGADRRYSCRSNCGCASLVYIAGRHLRCRMAGGARPYDRTQKVPVNCQTSLLRVANYVVLARGGGNAMVRSPVERSPLRYKPDRKTARTPSAYLSFSTLNSRSVGICRLLDILYSLVGDVLDRRFRAPADNKANRGIRSSGQELHRPKSGIRTLRGGTCLFEREISGSAEVFSRGAVRLACIELRNQHDICGCLADRSFHYALDVDHFRIFSPETQRYCGRDMPFYDLDRCHLVHVFRSSGTHL